LLGSNEIIRHNNSVRLLITARVNVYYTYPFNNISKKRKFNVKLSISLCSFR